jgi:hypothetical protein
MDGMWHRRIGFRGLPLRSVGLAAVISAGAISFALLRAWPLWAVGLVAMLPWVPLLALDMAWTVRRYQWLALFYLLAVTQLGHLGEHVAQVVQMHMLALSGPNARGIVGTLDIEWVHFVWNTWVLIAVLLLVPHECLAMADGRSRRVARSGASLHHVAVPAERPCWRTGFAGPGWRARWWFADHSTSPALFLQPGGDNPAGTRFHRPGAAHTAAASAAHPQWAGHCLMIGTALVRRRRWG